MAANKAVSIVKAPGLAATCFDYLPANSEFLTRPRKKMDWAESQETERSSISRFPFQRVRKKTPGDIRLHSSWYLRQRNIRSGTPDPKHQAEGGNMEKLGSF